MIIQDALWHIIFSTLLAAFLAFVFQGLNTWIAGFSLVAGTVLAYLCRSLYLETDNDARQKWDWVDKAVVGFILLIGLRQFAYLCFDANNSVRTLLKYNLGDLPLHITYMRHMIGGSVFPPNNPFFPVEKLHYPIGMDLYNALWEQLGVPTQTHLFAVGMVMLLATVLMLYRFGGVLMVGAFFLNGGLLGWQLLGTGILKDYQEAITWKNFFLTLFVTQRGIIMALPLGFWLLRQVRDRFYIKDSAAEPWSRGQAILVGIAWGALPLFHMHGFIVVSLLIAFYTLAGPAPRENLRQIAPVLSRAVPLASVFVLYLTDLFRKGSMIHLQWDWYTPSNLARFFGLELGPWTLFIVAVAAFRLLKGNSRERSEWLMAIGAFMLFNGVLLAPWEWDKLKVLIWFYLILAALGSRSVVQYLTPARKAGLCLVLFFSGSVCLLAASGGQVKTTKLYEWRELWYTKGAVSAIPKAAVIAAKPTYNHPLSFWGYAISVGYAGHLWSHGIDYRTHEALITQLYRGNGDWMTIAKGLHLTHIFWGPMERAYFGRTSPPWRAVFPNISPVPGYEVYAIETQPEGS